MAQQIKCSKCSQVVTIGEKRDREADDARLKELEKELDALNPKTYYIRKKAEFKATSPSAARLVELNAQLERVSALVRREERILEGEIEDYLDSLPPPPPFDSIREAEIQKEIRELKKRRRIAIMNEISDNDE